MNKLASENTTSTEIANKQTNKQIDKQTDRQADRHTLSGKQTNVILYSCRTGIISWTQGEGRNTNWNYFIKQAYLNLSDVYKWMMMMIVNKIYLLTPIGTAYTGIMKLLWNLKKSTYKIYNEITYKSRQWGNYGDCHTLTFMQMNIS